MVFQVNEQIKMQRYMEYLKSEIDKRDIKILSCQLHLRKSEIILVIIFIYYWSKHIINFLINCIYLFPK